MENARFRTAKEPLKYNEADLKAIVLGKLLREDKLNRKSCIANEFALGSERRADLALFNGTDLIGVEIKSDFDTLKRLKGQHEAYSKVFHRIIVVVAERHAHRVIDDNCGNADLWLVTPFGEVRLVRTAREKPTACKLALAALLPKSELAKVVGAVKNSRITRASLNSRIHEVDLEEIRTAVVKSFVSRFEVTSRRFFKSVTGSDVVPRNVTRLSRFEQQRKIIHAHNRKNAQFWKDWAKVADEVFGVVG